MAATKAFNRHLWYLSEVLDGFAIFDYEVTVEKRDYGSRHSMKMKDVKSHPNAVLFCLATGLRDLVTKSTARFFQILAV